MNPSLAWLTARRVLQPALLVGFALATLLVVRTRWTPDPRLAEALAFTGGLGSSPVQVAREGSWTALVLVFGSYLVARAASTIARARRGELELVGASGLGRGPYVLSSFGGHALAAGLLVLGSALAAELAADGPRAPFRRITLPSETPTDVLPSSYADGIPVSGNLGAGDTVRLRFAFFGGGPAGSVRCKLERLEGGATTLLEERVGGRRSVDLEVPGGSGPLLLSLERDAGSALIALEARGIELLERTGQASWLSRTGLLLRAWLALLSALALAFGFGAWLSSPTASLAVLAVIVPTLALGALGNLPWPQLAGALTSLGEGVEPAPPGPVSWVAALASVALGLLLARSGLSTWRRLP